MDYTDIFNKAAAGNPQALSQLLEVADADPSNAEVAFRLGFLFDVPEKAGIQLDQIRARHFYIKAAELGHPFAQLCIGNMFDYGEGGDCDKVEARHWYRLAATNGIADAQMHYARMLEVGRGGSQDFDGAANWYEKAAEQGNELAATNLASLHLSHSLSVSDPLKAVHLLHFAANKLDGIAHYLLSRIYLEGTVVEKDVPEALMHLAISVLTIPLVNPSHEVAAKFFDQLLKSISPDQHQAMRDASMQKAQAYVQERGGKLAS